MDLVRRQRTFLFKIHLHDARFALALDYIKHLAILDQARNENSPTLIRNLDLLFYNQALRPKLKQDGGDMWAQNLAFIIVRDDEWSVDPIHHTRKGSVIDQSRRKK